MAGPKIFVSYSRDDGADVADAIYQHYTRTGHTVFVSETEIRGSGQWMRRIMDAIVNCDVFLVVVTRSALNSIYVEKEVLEASKAKKAYNTLQTYSSRLGTTEMGT